MAKPAPHTRFLTVPQLLRLLESSHVADRGHDGERHHHVDPWDCHQAFDALVP